MNLFIFTLLALLGGLREAAWAGMQQRLPDACANAAADALYPIPREVQARLGVPATAERPFQIVALKPVKDGYVITIEFNTSSEAAVAMFGAKTRDELGIAVKAIERQKGFFAKTGVSAEVISRDGAEWARFTLPSRELANALAIKHGFQYYATRSESGLSPPIEMLWQLTRKIPHLPYDPLKPYGLHDVWGHFEGYHATPVEVWRLYQSRARLLMRMFDSPVGRELLNSRDPAIQKTVGEVIGSVVDNVDQATGMRRAVFATTEGGDKTFTPQGSLETSLVQYDDYDLSLVEWSNKMADTVELRAGGRIGSRFGNKLTQEGFRKIQDFLKRRAAILDDLPGNQKDYRLSSNRRFMDRLKSGKLVEELRGRFPQGAP